MKTKLFLAVIVAFLFNSTVLAQTPPPPPKGFSLSEVLVKANALPDSLKMPVIQAVAAGDSVKANTELKKAQKVHAKTKAQTQVDKTKAAAQAQLEKKWTVEVSPKAMTVEKCIAWIDSKAKAGFLSTRWIGMGIIGSAINTTGTFVQADVQKAFTAGVEAQESFKKAVDARVTARIGSAKDSRVDEILTRLTAVEAKATKAHNRLDNHWNHIDTINTRLDAVEGRLSEAEKASWKALRGIDYAKIRKDARDDADELQSKLETEHNEAFPPPADDDSGSE